LDTFCGAADATAPRWQLLLLLFFVTRFRKVKVIQNGTVISQYGCYIIYFFQRTGTGDCRRTEPPVIVLLFKSIILRMIKSHQMT
jgi:hypothetical protein